MTDKRPEPVATLCVMPYDDGESQRIPHRGTDTGNCEGKHTPLYPPSVVAGELRALASEIKLVLKESSIAPIIKHPCKVIADEAVRRAEKWEKP